MDLAQALRRMVAYTAWADRRMLDNAGRATVARLEEPREALFGDVRGTFDHIAVVAEMFEAHVEGRPNPHLARTRAERLSFAEVARRLIEVDARWVARVEAWQPSTLAEPVPFAFVDGGKGCMTRGDIVLHLANHATYHRGFVSTLLFPLGVPMQATDYSVFVRDVCVAPS